MNEEVRKQLEEMARICLRKNNDDASLISFYIAGATAAWELATQKLLSSELATKPSEDAERDADEYASSIHLYKDPQWVSAKEHFLAGRRGLREAVAFAVEEERKRCAVIVSTFKHEDIYAEARRTLARIQTNIINPPKDGA